METSVLVLSVLDSEPGDISKYPEMMALFRHARIWKFHDFVYI